MFASPVHLGRSLAFLGLITFLIGFVPHQTCARVVTIDIVPPQPSEQDTVYISIAGYLPSSCWSVTSTSCDSITANGVWLSANFYNTGAQFCLDIVIPYELTCTVGPLAAGTYHVTVTYYTESPYYTHSTTHETDFDVTTVTPIEHTTWGRIRVLYR